ncbi:MAG: cytochrome c peroxidase [Saprospiraceae bacterium]
MKNTLILTLSALMLLSCQKEEIIYPVGGDPTPYVIDIGKFPIPQIASDNPLTVQGVKLGRMLFYEKMLSGDNTMSCASCHQQKNAFSDTNQFSIGIRGQNGKRNAMGIFNLAWHGNEFFWDGRAHLLRDQSLRPIQDHLEMDENLENVVSKLSGSRLYTDQFIAAFGIEDITTDRISKALEQFMVSIVSNQSKYDQYLAGNLSLNTDEERGRVLFFKERNPFYPGLSGPDCAHCHNGSNFRNNKYLNNGLDDEASITDIGRQSVSLNPDDKGKFKVPSLRNIALTAPYMHDGRFKSLEDVIDHYDHNIKPSTSLDPVLEERRETGLHLSAQDKSDLVAFLKTLTDQQLLSDARYSSPF